MFYDDDADLSIIQGRTVAVIGSAPRATPTPSACAIPVLTSASA